MTRSPITTLAGIAGLVLVNAPAIAQNGSFDSGIVGGSIIGGGSFESSSGGGGTTSGAWGGSSLGSGPSITRPSITNRHFSTGTAVGGSGGFSLGGQGGGGSGGRRK